MRIHDRERREELWNLMEDNPGLPGNPIDEWEDVKGGDDAKQAGFKQLETDLSRARMAKDPQTKARGQKAG